MKYLWIIVLGIACVLWSIYSVLDIIYCFMTFERGYRLNMLDVYTCVWIACALGVPLFYSFYLWLE